MHKDNINGYQKFYQKITVKCNNETSYINFLADCLFIFLKLRYLWKSSNLTNDINVYDSDFIKTKINFFFTELIYSDLRFCRVPVASMFPNKVLLKGSHTSLVPFSCIIREY